MPLEELVETIETLRQRMADHRNSLRESKTRTRMALVEPVLRVLGWDTTDPSRVRAEYRKDGADGERLEADYLLKTDNAADTPVTNRVAIDVLPLDHDSHPDGWRRLLETCRENNIPLAVMTDGNGWEIRQPEDETGENTISLRLTKQPPHKAAIDLLALWPKGN